MSVIKQVKMHQYRFVQLTFILSIICSAFGQSNIAGKFSNNIDAGHLIIPRKVHENGTFLSHNLTHHHDINSFDNLHYRIDLPSETLHLELEPSHDFIAPLMVIERHRRDTRTRKKHHKHTHRCHFQGRVRGDHKSNVAISTCNGINGLVRTKRGDFYIEPSKHHQLKETGHPHVMFQRSAVSSDQEQKVSPNAIIRQRRKRRRGRKHAASNCGTKEPKRPTESQIEWETRGKVSIQASRRTHIRRNRNFSAKQRRAKMRQRHMMERKRHQKLRQQEIVEEMEEAKHEEAHTRNKRSISSPRHVEALVVADPSMVAFHQDGDVETYLLTIMNMVSSLYKDPAIGNHIKVVVVRIVLLEEDELQSDLNVTHLAESNLHNFCRWQRLQNPKNETDPHHHDVAILITRKDICSSAGCTTLGVANVGGMCRPDRSCSVNEDNGITLAHTITHELGHNFGMYHDTEKTGCDSRAGSVVHVMTPSFEADTIQVSWSNCSRRDITHFLDQGLGKCLDDPPTEEEFTYPDLPPGAMYKADQQCRLQFNTTDENVRVCSKPSEICSQLWCLVDDECTSQLRPAAPGTHCGKHKWCQNQECVPIEDLPSPVDGGWGDWNEWSECSRTCGGGVSMQSRQCNNPIPENGGAFCVGERIRYKICNQQTCPEDEPSFRAQQCSKFNNETYRGKTYNWMPYFDSHDPCELYCTDSDDTLIVPWGDSAADGTPCTIGKNDMCISGICRKVGCDWVVDSNTTEDQCGVCGGTGENCTTIKMEFNKKMNTSDGYFQIAIIPKGSRQIFIEEIHPTKNFLSIGKTGTNQTFLNGHRLIFMPGEFKVGYLTGLYERENEQEKITIPGPVPFDLTLEVLVRGKSKNPGIKYEYTLSSNDTIAPKYYWKLGDWSACTKTCGGGTQHRSPVCFEETRGVVDEQNCKENAEGNPPDKKTRVCNEDPCPAHWWIGPWQLCPVTCKRSNQPDPVKRRSIMCVDHNEIALSDSHCNVDLRPIDSEVCGQYLPICNDDDNTVVDNGDVNADNDNSDNSDSNENSNMII